MSARNTVFLAASSISGLTELNGASGPILDEYAAISARLGEAGAPDLLAEPVVSRNGAGGATVAWYTALDGTAQRYADLSPAAQEWARLRLERLLLAHAGPALGADPDGAKLARALSVASPRDIFVINGEPVLTNWGLVPEAAAASPEAFAAHHAATLGVLAPAFPAPPFSSAQESGFLAGLASAGAAASSGMAPQEEVRRRRRAPEAPPPPPPPPVAVAAPERGGRHWVAPLVATLIAAAVLIFLLIPGVLIYPAAATAVDDGRLTAAQSRLIASLEAREQQLKTLLASDICPRPPEPVPEQTPVPTEP